MIGYIKKEVVDLIRKITMILWISTFLPTSLTFAETSKQIEIFDIEKGTVIKTVPLNLIFQTESAKILNSIKDIYKKVNPIPNKGLMVKIPLNPMIPVQNQWLTSHVDEIIIFLPEDEEPYIMTFDDENNVYFFTINNQNSVSEFILKTLSLSQ